jgi:hypothetical protein
MSEFAFKTFYIFAQFSWIFTSNILLQLSIMRNPTHLLQFAYVNIDMKFLEDIFLLLLQISF